MYEKDDKIMSELSRRSTELYDAFRKRAAEHNVPLKIALREAMRMWMHHEAGDKEFSRLTAIYIDYLAIRTKVKDLLDAEDLEDLEEKINEIIREY